MVRPSQCPCRVYIPLSRVSVVCVAVASWYHVRPRGSTSPGLSCSQPQSSPPPSVRPGNSPAGAAARPWTQSGSSRLWQRRSGGGGGALSCTEQQGISLRSLGNTTLYRELSKHREYLGSSLVCFFKATIISCRTIFLILLLTQLRLI